MTGKLFLVFDLVPACASAIYFYSLLFFGNYVLLNIFIAIVVVGFGDSQG